MQQLLFAGKYDEVIAASQRRATLAPADAAAVLGAYAFSGRMDEALALFRLYGRDADAEFGEAARFFLVAGFCHAGDVRRAATLVHRAPDPAWTARQRFYAAQAHGLVSFFRGRMVRAAKAARLALEAAVASKFSYGQMLAHDLRASALAAMGRLGASQRLWDAARELAHGLGLAPNAASIGCSQLVARVSADPHDAALDARLEATLLAGEVSYFAERHGWTTLAMARALRGETTGAERAIAKAASISLANNDLRARVRWLVASAYVRRFRGAALGHATLLADAYALAKRSANRALMVDVLCAQYMLDAPAITATRAEMEALHAATGLARLRWMLDAMAAAPPYPVEDWLFSQLLDTSAMTAADRCQHFAGAGLLGLAIAALHLPPRHRIYLAHDRLLVEQADGVRGYPMPLANAVRVLRALADGPRSKASLLGEIWNVRTYHAQVHDNALFTAIARLRASLGDAGAWVTTTATGYALAAEVEVIDLREAMTATPASGTSGATEAIAPPPALDLEPRAQAVLALAARGPVQSPEVIRALRVSEATALRVLRGLVERGQLQRRGTGRATQYELVSSPAKEPL